MATKLTLKIGPGSGPLCVVHRLDRPWTLRLSGLGVGGRAEFLGRIFHEDGEYSFKFEGVYVQCDAIDVTQNFRAELVMT